MNKIIECISTSAEKQWLKIVNNFPENLNSENVYQLYAKKRREFIKRYKELPTTENENNHLLSLKNKYKGERIFLIGNGPSLNNTPLEFLEGEYTFGVNRIYLLFDRINWRPTFFTVNDWEVGPDNAPEINELEGMTFFFPTRFRGLFKEKPSTYWYNSRNRRNKNDVFSYDLTDGAVMGGTIMALVMQIAYFMGFDPVYLIGTDVDYKVNKTVRQEGKLAQNGNKQFLQSTVNDDPNHFDHRYFGKGQRWHCPDIEMMKDGFVIAKKAFEDKGRRIYNATVGGKLEVLERIDFKSLFRKTKIKPIVSIIMPAYNAEKYINEAVQSVINQTFSGWELIIVNDGSTDGTKDIILSYKDPRIICIDQTNKGRAEARNTALNHAKGKFIAFLDADDIFSPIKLEEQVKFLSNDKTVDGVVGEVNRIKEDGSFIRKAVMKQGGLITKEKFFLGNPAHVIGTMLRRSTIKNQKFNSEAKAGEDWEFFLHLAIKDSIFFKQSVIVGSYRMTEQAIAKTSEKYAKNMVSVLDRVFKQLPPNSNYESYKDKAYYFTNMRMAARLFSTSQYDQGALFLKKAASYAIAIDEKFFRFAANQICFWLEQLDINRPEIIIKQINKIFQNKFDTTQLSQYCYNLLNIKASQKQDSYKLKPLSGKNRVVCKHKGKVQPADTVASKLKFCVDTNYTLNSYPNYKINKKSITLVVLGNGPSLKGFDLARFEPFNTIGMNAAYRYWEKTNIYPDYYICLDTIVGESHKEKIYELIQKRMMNGTKLFFLRKVLLEFYPDLTKIPEVIFLEDYFKSPYFDGLTQDLTTGSFAALLGAMLGYKLIYLFGVDLNYVQQIPEARKDGGYVLEISETPNNNPNYFFDDYQRKGDRYNVPDSSMPNLHYHSWVKVKERLERFGIHVFNCNENSQVDIFNYANVDEILTR